MIETSLAIELAADFGFAIAGFGFGLLYFEGLRRTAARIGARSGWLVPVALTVARVGAAVIVFGCAVRFGAAALLCVFAGFLAARALALRARRGRV